MLKSIKDFFEARLLPTEDVDPEIVEREIQLASAALMIELSKADFKVDESEWSTLISLLKSVFDLDDESLDELVQLANDALEDSIDLYQFTKLVNEHYSYQDKKKLVFNMWRVAYADGRIHQYEEYLIRKVSDLIYVTHSDFIQTKIQARQKDR